MQFLWRHHLHAAFSRHPEGMKQNRENAQMKIWCHYLDYGVLREWIYKQRWENMPAAYLFSLPRSTICNLWHFHLLSEAKRPSRSDRRSPSHDIGVISGPAGAPPPLPWSATAAPAGPLPPYQSTNTHVLQPPLDPSNQHWIIHPWMSYCILHISAPCMTVEQVVTHEILRGRSEFMLM